MKKIIIIVVVVLAVIAAAFTCPNEKQHHEAMTPVMGRVASNVAQQKTSGVGKLLKGIGLGNEEKVKNGYDKVGATMAPGLVKMIEVHDYCLFSLGKMDYEGKTYPVSLGIYGMVFALPLDKIQEAMAD